MKSKRNKIKKDKKYFLFILRSFYLWYSPIQDGTFTSTLKENRMKTNFFVAAALIMVSFAGFAEASRHYNDSYREVREHRGYSSNKIKIYGTVDAMPRSGFDGIWRVNGREIIVNQGTRIKEKYGRLGLGAYVEIEGFYANNGGIQAYEIEVKGGRNYSYR
jgi:hypothetical protein